MREVKLLHMSLNIEIFNYVFNTIASDAHLMDCQLYCTANLNSKHLYKLGFNVNDCLFSKKAKIQIKRRYGFTVKGKKYMKQFKFLPLNE